MHPKLSETLSKYSTIILVGGGTGGHVQPIVSIISSFEKELPTRNEEAEDFALEKIPPTHLYTGGIPTFLWIGGKDSQEAQAAQENHVEFVSIPTFKLSTTRSPKILLYPFVLIQWIWEARRILEFVMSTESWELRTTRHLAQENAGQDFSLHSTWQWQSLLPIEKGRSDVCVFSKWWPWSVAVGIAAWTLDIPLYIHESDTIPGRSNRILGKIATKIFLGFDSARKYFDSAKCEVIWQILNQVFSARHCEPAKQSRKIEQRNQLDRFMPRDDRNRVQWKTDKKHLLAICGSQWARVIFEELLKNLEIILKDHEVILILGKLNTDMRKDFEEKLRILNLESWILNLIDWISQEDLAHIIPDTDIVITRGSATTLAELTSFQHSNTPTFQHSNIQLIIIPLPYAADNHQYYNALEYEKLWHTFLEQKNLNQLSETLKKLWQNSQPSNI